VQESVEDVRPMLPTGSKVVDIQLREPFFHGDTCIAPLTNRAGDTLLLVHAGAFVDERGGLDAIRRMLGDRFEVLPVDREDALGYACNTLAVNGTLLMPRGLSTGLRGQLARRGFTLVELGLDELFGKGGGGPRCLVNELRGLAMSPEAPSYAAARDALEEAAAQYPQQAPAPEAT
jgi:N-dimethylarginine dimethylaminohydrolase